MKPTTVLNRYRVLILISLVLVILLTIVMYNMQVDAAKAREDDSITKVVTSTYSTTLHATRGNLLDRYGNPLVANEQVFSLQFNRSNWKTSNQSEVILSLLNLIKSKGTTYQDSLPISNAPFSYTISAGADVAIRKDFDKYLEKNDWDPNLKASEVVTLMSEKYHLADNYSNAERRAILGLLYDMEVAEFSVYNPFLFLEDVDMEIITAIRERSFYYSGVEIITQSSRVYKTDVGAHILGRVGKIYKEEYEELASQNYSMNAIVGKDGAEKAFESYLRGINGSLKTKIDAFNNTVEVVSETQPKAGYNVLLTIDERIQAATEEALARRIEEIKVLSEDNPEDYPEDIGGGAAVMMKVDSAEVLAMASYPDYNLASFSEDYDELLENKLTPMVNRVIGGTYPIGSVFKMVTAVAALEEGVITPDTIIKDEGIYTKYRTFQPQCWIYRQNYHATHGNLNVSMALRDSCNYFFYQVADDMGIETLDKWAQAFGLGKKTGIELSGEVSGQRSNVETKAKSSSIVWGPGDTLTTAIGQSYSLFTPLQVCAYLSAVCNGGYYYQPHILKEVTTYDYSSVVVSVQPTLVNTISMSNSTYKAVMDGMLDAAENGTAAKVFENYPIRVGGKTGSSQVASGTSNGVFAAFAPFDDPEIAVFIIVEHGGSGSNIGIIARDMFDAYFNLSTNLAEVKGVNTLVN